MASNAWIELPMDVVLCIFDNLSIGALLRLCSTGRRLYARFWKSYSLWMLLYRRDVTERTVPEDVEATYRRTMLDYESQPKDDVLAFLVMIGAEKLLQRELAARSGDYISRALTIAADKGDAQIVVLLLDGASDRQVVSHNVLLNRALFGAANGNHVSLVELLLTKGASDIRWAFITAAYKGSIDVLKYLHKTYGACRLRTDLALREAARGENPAVMDFFAENGYMNQSH